MSPSFSTVRSPPFWALSGAAVGAANSEGIPELPVPPAVPSSLLPPHDDSTPTSATSINAGNSSLSRVNRIFRSFRLV